MWCKSFVDVCNNVFRATWRSFMMRRLKTRRAPAKISRDSIDHATIRLSAANKNNPICANAAEFERIPSIASVHQFAPSTKKVLLPRVLSSLENYRFSMLGKRAPCSQQTEKQRQSNRGWNTSRSVDMPRKTARIRPEDSLQPREPTTNQREGGNRDGPFVLSLPLSYFLGTIITGR